MIPPRLAAAAGAAARRSRPTSFTVAAVHHPAASCVSSNSSSCGSCSGSCCNNGPLGCGGSGSSSAASVASVRYLSTEAKARKIDPTDATSGSTNGGMPRHSQDFVKVRLEPGEWDEEKTDPIYRPKWNPNQSAKIISAEDFANRPRAGFGEEFASLHDGMVVLSWLNQAERDRVYDLYCDLMTQMSSSDSGKTSHEYAVRVIAQKTHLAAARVAAIIEQQFEEDRIRREEPDRRIHYKLQDYVDAKMQETIEEVYDAYGETPPNSFAESPMASGVGAEPPETHATARAEDLFDVDDLLRQAVIREREEAQLAIDRHIYIEDVDDSKQDVKINAECRALMQSRNATADAMEAKASDDVEADAAAVHVGSKLARPDDQRPLPEFGRGIGGVWTDRIEPSADGTPPRRPRYKYVAKIINTRAESKLTPDERRAKKARARRKKKKAAARGIAADEDVQNTLVEYEGRLRPATAEEVSNVAWKPVRNQFERSFENAKRAWVGQKLRGEKGVWGRVERDPEKEREIEEKWAASLPQAGGAEAEEAAKEEEAREKAAAEEEAKEFTGVCYNCGESGHLAKDCTNPSVQGEAKEKLLAEMKANQRCFRCGETGHIASKCPNK